MFKYKHHQKERNFKKKIASISMLSLIFFLPMGITTVGISEYLGEGIAHAENYDPYSFEGEYVRKTELSKKVVDSINQNGTLPKDAKVVGKVKNEDGTYSVAIRSSVGNGADEVETMVIDIDENGKAHAFSHFENYSFKDENSEEIEKIYQSIVSQNTISEGELETLNSNLHDGEFSSLEVNDDTIDGIAKKYNISKEKLVAFGAGAISIAGLAIAGAGSSSSSSKKGGDGTSILENKKNFFPMNTTAEQKEIVNLAESLEGIPYVWGGTTESGFDCSGFVQYVFNRAGIEIPRTADVQYEVGQEVSKEELQPGDVVFFETYEPGASHCGIYKGDGILIHASSSMGQICEVDLNDDYRTKTYYGSKRMVGLKSK